MLVYFEDCGRYITAAKNDGTVKIRCNFEYTDCREDEDLRAFIERHGGEIDTADYLKECYANATKL